LAEEKQKKTAELRRLLYVGMTRAEKELYLTGCLGMGKEGDNFSLQLKEFINEKQHKAEGKNAVAGDSILDDDTFFGLCLPALGEYIPPEGLAAGASFFQLEEIPAYTEDHVDHWENRGGAVLSNDQKGLNAFFEKVKPFYQKAEVIHTPQVMNNHLTPVSLRQKESSETDAQTFVISKSFSGEDSGDVFEKVDSMLARYAGQDEEGGEQFNSRNFGTIAHACAEALLNGEEAAIPPELAGYLDPREAGAFLAAGTELAARFLRSPLGVIARNAGLRENEFPFRTLVQDPAGSGVFINGIIDLLFEDDQAVYVVDFKTDSRENPAEHSAQMSCYFQAASALFAVPAQKECQVWLYYLRTGHAVKMSEQTKLLTGCK
jgi:ATP-dependent helicase/nuclease subunit A